MLAAVFIGIYSVYINLIGHYVATFCDVLGLYP